MRNNESSLYPGFVIPREFVRSLLGRIQGTRRLVRNNESSSYPGFVIPREFVRSLLGRIQGTRRLVRYTGKFVISGARYIRIPLYIIL